MKFEEALQAMREGQKVRRESWRPGYHYHLDSIFLLTSDGYDAYIHANDLLATDWQIADDPTEPDIEELQCECDRLLEQMEGWRAKYEDERDRLRTLETRNKRQAETIRLLQEQISRAKALLSDIDKPAVCQCANVRHTPSKL